MPTGHSLGIGSYAEPSTRRPFSFGTSTGLSLGLGPYGFSPPGLSLGVGLYTIHRAFPQCLATDRPQLGLRFKDLIIDRPFPCMGSNIRSSSSLTPIIGPSTGRSRGVWLYIGISTGCSLGCGTYSGTSFGLCRSS